MAKQIRTIGATETQHALYPVTSKSYYDCANAQINRGATNAPDSLDKCFDSFSGVKDIAQAIGFLTLTGPAGTSYSYNLWTGATADYDPNVTTPQDIFFNNSDTECDKVNTVSFGLGLEWLGCLWGSPAASYSCLCPDIGPKYEAYLKFRLNNATFWATPKETPANRAEFLDALKYGRKVDVTIAGDFNLKVGHIVEFRANGISGYPYGDEENELNGYYYIIGIKHVVSNSGTHESSLQLSQIASVIGIENQIVTLKQIPSLNKNKPNNAIWSIG